VSHATCSAGTCTGTFSGTHIEVISYSGKVLHPSSATGSLIPDFVGIQVNGVKAVSSASGAKSVFDGYSAAYPLTIDLENVALDTTASTAKYASVGLDSASMTPSGTRVSTRGVSATGSVPACTFPAYPSI
jgi:polygalacturonase